MLCAVIISFPHAQDGITPLYVACQNGHKQIVIVLLESGANVNLTTTVSSLSGAYSELSSWLQHLFVPDRTQSVNKLMWLALAHFRPCTYKPPIFIPWRYQIYTGGQA